LALFFLLLGNQSRLIDKKDFVPKLFKVLPT